MEFTALVEGLKIAVRDEYQKLILEGDAAIIISICRKIIHGTRTDKTSHSWRLSALIETLPILLQSIEVTIPCHVRREANKIADHPTNLSVENQN